jgi:hypothetical protein
MERKDDYWDRLPSPGDPDVTAFSNAVRLTGREWLFVLVCSALFVMFAPALWKQVEPLEPGADYRMPDELQEDYWQYDRYATLAAGRSEALVIGDSVVWGEYVKPDGALSHYLNELGGQRRFANLGLNGAHPLALEGLVTYYAAGVRGKRIVLQCNPLWFSSPEADLQVRPKQGFNHARLIPQFLPWIPAYNTESLWQFFLTKRDEISPHIGVLVERRLPVSTWATHLQKAYYRGSDIPSWTLEYPYENPLAPLAQDLPTPSGKLKHLSLPWYKQDKSLKDFPWVDMETSLQWAAFRRTVEVLRRRDNQVFVLVGPFNEHMLTPDCRARFGKVKAAISDWLKAENIPHAAPSALDTDLYGDASHPLAEGYERLARQLQKEPALRNGN